MTQRTLLLDSTNVVELSRLKDEVTDLYLSDATATLDLYDANGNPVSGATGLTMDFTAGSGSTPGKYRGAIPASVVLVEDGVYDARVTAVATDGSQRVFHLSCTAVNG